MSQLRRWCKEVIKICRASLLYLQLLDILA